MSRARNQRRLQSKHGLDKVSRAIEKLSTLPSVTKDAAQVAEQMSRAALAVNALVDDFRELHRHIQRREYVTDRLLEALFTRASLVGVGQGASDFAKLKVEFERAFDDLEISDSQSGSGEAT